MNSAKQEVAQLLGTLPEDCSFEDIQYHLYVMDKVKKGLEDVEQGGGMTLEEAEARLQKWLTD